jgi:hypothetical protein
MQQPHQLGREALQLIRTSATTALTDVKDIRLPGCALPGSIRAATPKKYTLSYKPNIQ